MTPTLEKFMNTIGNKIETRNWTSKHFKITFLTTLGYKGAFANGKLEFF